MRIFDVDTVARFIGHPEIYPMMADDYSQIETAEKAAVAMVSAGIWAVQPSEHTLFLLFPRTVTMWEVHTMILPEGRGRKAIIDGHRALDWLFENSSCEKVISYIPAFNGKALFYAKKVGMKVEGIVTRSFRKNNALHDQIMVGISKEDVCQSYQPQVH